MDHILFVDDDSAFLDSTARLLRGQTDKWRLFFCDSADKAMECMAAHRVSLVVCDVRMPGKSGLDLLAEIKARRSTKNIPVIMVTGQVDMDAKLTALQMGASDLLNKPFDRAELIVRIDNSLKLKTFHDEIARQNTRLKDEVSDRRKISELVSDTISALVEEEQLDRLLQKCCTAMVDHLDAAFARIWVADEQKDHLELMASAGMYTHINGNHRFIPVGEYKIGLIAQDRQPRFTNTVIGDPDISDQAWAEREQMISFAGLPLIAEGKLVGVMGMFSKKVLKASVMDALSSVADGIALGIAQKKSVNEARYYSYYDPLTDMPNRKFFYVFLEKIISSANRNPRHFALVLLDIDDFRRVNDNLGHTVGDHCLKIMSQRLSKVLRSSDCLAYLSVEESPIARMGGDEFAVLLQDASDVYQVDRAVRRLLKKLSKSMAVDGRDLILTSSAGIAVFPDNGESVSDLFKNAETALYHAKKKGKGGFAFYSQWMNHRSMEILDLEIDLRHAVEKQAFSLYYQPKIALETNRLVGAEALIRWEKEKGTFISPARFIPLAEETGLILSIGDWVVKTACRQNVAWQNAGMTKIPLAVNVSGRQFGQQDFIQRVIQILDTTGLLPEYLEVEVTETALMQNPEKSVNDLAQIKELGVQISLDDFGTGYSSLSYLQKLPIDALKIDISFIQNILSNPKDAEMVRAIISMAHNLGVKVIAEGVEEKQQLDYLTDIGCDVAQGFWFSPPVPSSEFEVFLQDPLASNNGHGPSMNVNR